jgi:peptidoglycan/xylan/chitin deacetylase (PgdA/CDA1 family)
MGKLKGLLKYWRHRPPDKAVILMYHRVARVDMDPWSLCVTPERFDRQLAWLGKHCRVVSLRQLVGELAGGELIERTVAITFDDGYADNLTNGEPLLARHGLPATFFLTSRAIGSAHEFWWDELERLLLGAKPLPPTLRFTVDSQVQTFHRGRAAASRASLRHAIMKTRPWAAAADTRLGFYYSIWQVLRKLTHDARRAALAEISEQLGQADVARADHRTLTPSETKQLAAAPQVDIGAHSVTHSAFSNLDPATQRWEMQQSRHELEALIGKPVFGFAYPYGDYGPETSQIARDVGFEFACTTDGTRITNETERFLLPRLAVENWSTGRLARRVRRVLG